MGLNRQTVQPVSKLFIQSIKDRPSTGDAQNSQTIVSDGHKWFTGQFSTVVASSFTVNRCALFSGGTNKVPLELRIAPLSIRTTAISAMNGEVGLSRGRVALQGPERPPTVPPTSVTCATGARLE